MLLQFCSECRKECLTKTCSKECRRLRKIRLNGIYQKAARATPEGRAYHRMKMAEYRQRVREWEGRHDQHQG